MHAWICRLVFAGMLLVAFGTNGVSAQQVGEAFLINTSVTGNGRTLVSKSPVHRDELIRTSNTGLGEFLFRDGTKLAVGRNSSVVIDKFVFDDSKSVKTFSVKAAKGSFRWISGGSSSSAYKIATPAGTIGIRGTAFDVYVGPGGTTAVVVLNGRVQFCGANGCKDLRRRCDFVVATPKGGVSEPGRVSTDALRKLQNTQALPFITGNQKLSRRFRVGTDCLTTASIDKNKTKKTGSTYSRSAPSPEPEPEPPAPSPARGKGNNGYGNGGGDGSPNGRTDSNR